MRRRDVLALLAGSLAVPLSTDLLAASRPTGNRLILVELAGANDGLNTLVPWRNDDYRRLRPTLALADTDIVRLDDEFGLHRALKPLLSAHQANDLALVQGLGYPRPNRSHFQSIALWERAGDGERTARRQGWMTHAIEHELGARRPDVDGMSLAGGLSLFESDGGRWLSADSVAQLLDGGQGRVMSAAIDNAIVTRIARRYAALDRTLARLHEKLAAAPEAAPLDGGQLGQQLRVVTQFIGAGIDVPVYRVRLDGFDTHAQQLGRHASLLAELGTALASLRARLIEMGEWKSTVIMSYSEFGRRAAENASSGTDHGTAAPHLVMGGRVRGGLYGSAPDLADAALVDGDPVHTMDYRSLYAKVLESGLGAVDKRLTKHADSRLSGLIG